MPRSDRTVPRWRRPGALAAGVALLAFTAALAVPTVVTGASTFDGRSGSDSGTDRVIVCDSGTVHQGDVTTSSAVAVRVPDGAAMAVPSGCRED
jgi:hypothetical protein